MRKRDAMSDGNQWVKAMIYVHPGMRKKKGWSMGDHQCSINNSRAFWEQDSKKEWLRWRSVLKQYVPVQTRSEKQDGWSDGWTVVIQCSSRTFWRCEKQNRIVREAISARWTSYIQLEMRKWEGTVTETISTLSCSVNKFTHHLE